MVSGDVSEPRNESLQGYGEEYNINAEDGYINSFGVFDLGTNISRGKFKVSLKINNVFNKLYSTYGYSYDYNGYNAYYWPAAERNTFINVSYKL